MIALHDLLSIVTRKSLRQCNDLIIPYSFLRLFSSEYVTRFFFIRTKFIRTQAFGHPEIKNMIITQGFPQQ